jgi:hypothetical protein
MPGSAWGSFLVAVVAAAFAGAAGGLASRALSAAAASAAPANSTRAAVVAEIAERKEASFTKPAGLGSSWPNLELSEIAARGRQVRRILDVAAATSGTKLS